MAKAKNQIDTNSSNCHTESSSATNNPSYPLNSISNSNGIPSKLDTRSSIDKADSSSSHNISISSINEDDNNGSSTFESSDSECDDEQIKKAIERIPTSVQTGGQLVQNGMLLVNDSNGSPTSARGPNIGSIAVQNSSDITFGNKTYIKGQVVIKHIYRDKQNGTVNNGFIETDDDLNDSKPNVSTNPVLPHPKWQSSLKAIIKDKPMLSGIVVVLLIFAVIAIGIIAYVIASADKDFLPDAKPLRIVTRNEWLAQPPNENLTDLVLPVHKVIIAHTATEGCKTQSECVFLMQHIQRFHMASDSRNFADIAYNFVVGGDGNGYVGRGWDKQGAHTKGFNGDSIGIAFIGTFTNIQPPTLQLSAAEQLIQEGVNSGYVVSNYSLYGHRQLAPFESPGKKLYEIIKTWPNWASDLKPGHYVET